MIRDFRRTGGVDEGSEDTALRIFEGLAKSYDFILEAATLLLDRRWKRWLVRKASIKGGERVLDIGAGTLILEERAMKMVPGVVALDLTKEMIMMGRAKRLGNVVLIIRGDAVHLPFPSESFDLVVSCYVPKYVSGPAFAKELSRIVPEGGRVVTYDFSRPRGLGAPLVWGYLLGVFPLLGTILRGAGRKEAITFELLPKVIKGTSWEKEFPKEMEAAGFETITLEQLTSGAATGYAGVKRGLR